MDTIQFDLFNPPQDDTLTKARKNVMEGRLVGVYCPCCDQLAKMYKISISVNQVRLLFKLYALTLHKATPGDEYFHITRDISKGVVDNVGGSFAKLVYWHMIEEKPNEPEKTESRTSGLWKILPLGISFIKHEVRVPKYSLVYDNKFYGYEGGSVDVISCLGKHFNYTELMNEVIHSYIYQE